MCVLLWVEERGINDACRKKNYKGAIVSLHIIIHLVSIQRVSTEIMLFREFMMKVVSPEEERNSYLCVLYAQPVTGELQVRVLLTEVLQCNS